jgi:hypothetical protein
MIRQSPTQSAELEEKFKKMGVPDRGSPACQARKTAFLYAH